MIAPDLWVPAYPDFADLTPAERREHRNECAGCAFCDEEREAL